MVSELGFLFWVFLVGFLFLFFVEPAGKEKTV